jgi:hypothetical protein
MTPEWSLGTAFWYLRRFRTGFIAEVGRRWAYQLIDAAEVCAIAHTENESQARELVPLKHDPDA